MAEDKPIISIRVEGLDAANAKLKALAAKLPAATDRLIEDGGEMIFADSQRLVPVDTGTLQRSGSHLHKPMLSEVGYNTPYAAFVHDGTSNQQAQPFLRQAVEINLPKIEKKMSELSK